MYGISDQFVKLAKHAIPIDGRQLQAETEGKRVQRSAPL